MVTCQEKRCHRKLGKNRDVHQQQKRNDDPPKKDGRCRARILFDLIWHAIPVSSPAKEEIARADTRRVFYARNRDSGMTIAHKGLQWLARLSRLKWAL